jgi:hypothetical protein
MTALAAGAIISGGLGVYKAIDGANQKADAKRLATNNKFIPETMPGQVKLATNLAAQNYYNGMPGQAQAAAAINSNGANQFYNGSQAASSGGDLLDLASKINVGQNAATNDLSTRSAEYKANALGGYQSALNNEGRYQDKLYENNVLQPYLRTANAASAMYGAGAQNEFSGLDQIGTAGLGYVNGLAQQNDAKPDAVAKATTSPFTNRTQSMAQAIAAAKLAMGQ